MLHPWRPLDCKSCQSSRLLSSRVVDKLLKQLRLSRRTVNHQFLVAVSRVCCNRVAHELSPRTQDQHSYSEVLLLVAFVNGCSIPVHLYFRPRRQQFAMLCRREGPRDLCIMVYFTHPSFSKDKGRL